MFSLKRFFLSICGCFVVCFAPAQTQASYEAKLEYIKQNHPTLEETFIKTWADFQKIKQDYLVQKSDLLQRYSAGEISKATTKKEHQTLVTDSRKLLNELIKEWKTKLQAATALKTIKPNIPLETFTELQFKIEDQTLYYKNKAVNIDLNSFEFIDQQPLYPADKNQVYYLRDEGLLPIKNVDRESFQVITLEDNPGSVFSKDKNNVYFEENPIEEADHKTFKISTIYSSSGSTELFIRDKNHVYNLLPYKSNRLSIEIVNEADPLTFEFADDIKVYAHDKNHVYYHLFGRYTVVEHADPNTFSRVPLSNFYKDKNHVFYERLNGLNILPNIDPNSFNLLNSSFIKDNSMVYFVNNDLSIQIITAIKQADVKTFEVLNDRFAKDKNNVYELQTYPEKIIIVDCAPSNFIKPTTDPSFPTSQGPYCKD